MKFKGLFGSLFLYAIWLVMTTGIAAAWAWAWLAGYKFLVTPMAYCLGYTLPIIPYIWWFCLYILIQLITASIVIHPKKDVADWRDQSQDEWVGLIVHFFNRIYNAGIIGTLAVLCGILWV